MPAGNPHRASDVDLIGDMCAGNSVIDP
jgi:hypothetical protein